MLSSPAKKHNIIRSLFQQLFSLSLWERYDGRVGVSGRVGVNEMSTLHNMITSKMRVSTMARGDINLYHYCWAMPKLLQHALPDSIEQ